MVTYSDLFTFVMMLVSVISLTYTIAKGKKEVRHEKTAQAFPSGDGFSNQTN